MSNVIIDNFRKLKWAFKNYGEIGYTKKLIHSKEVGVPDVFLGPITYQTDCLVTSNNCDFINEPRFAKAYAAAAATKPWAGFTLQWRVYIVCWFADFVKHLEGDFVECGVNTGAYARAIIDYIDFPSLDKKFYLFDTFGGLVQNQLTSKEKELGFYKHYNHYEDVYEQVKNTFAPFNVEVVKGIVPDTLVHCKSEKIAYLSIDMNVTAPEIAAINYFWDKIVPGGIVMLDDYGFAPHIEQKKAFDTWAKEKSVNILSLPTGQGVIIKQK
ncbi:TylF/MycF/NovP-related O-methyltransferase [Flavihumibacter sp. ZG627]|uniref:TylF/MycF/NovP-related O-methyltransferase n=1 Tax=Flavihumibacter sp. ZG627 TaxID=1463156 RepID=UPI0006941D27|nr:TylF/MycF/NovP-related O-methyltransferase [Flavihumibacter sp. ZG627]